jgi:HAD superfamily hydrolase (TIGR01549 family)
VTQGESPRGADRRDLLAITLDFGNTLVPVDGSSLRGVVHATAVAMSDRAGGFTAGEFLEAWADERERQFREEIPRFREVDIAQRVVRVLARLRGMAPPPADVPWDDAAAAARSSLEEVDLAIDTYSGAFVEALPAPPGVEPLLARLAGRWRLGLLSNWPLAATIDRYLEAAGWDRHLSAVVVSQRVGAIKPHPAIFRAAEAALGLAAADRERILHVGDDWAADVVGAKRAGWRSAYLTARPESSPLPSSEPDDTVEADLEVASLEALEEALAAGGPS